MEPLSNTSLSVLNTVLSWVAIASIAIALIAAIGLHFVSAETSRRQDHTLSEANREITKLQPKPLKDRIITFLDDFNPEVLKLAKQGTKVFPGCIMTNAQVADLQRLCAEDSGNRYIIWVPTGNVMIGTGGSGTQGGIGFSVTDELLK